MDQRSTPPIIFPEPPPTLYCVKHTWTISCHFGAHYHGIQITPGIQTYLRLDYDLKIIDGRYITYGIMQLNEISKNADYCIHEDSKKEKPCAARPSPRPAVNRECFCRC